MSYPQLKTLELSVPYSSNHITTDFGRHVASQIKEAISEAVTKNYKPRPPRFDGDIDETFNPCLLKIINAATYSSAEYGKELPDFLKIQYGNRGNVCHIQLQPIGL